jgi:hypothetical protein
MSDLTFLISDVRTLIGDISTPYRFEDATIENALFTAVKLLGRRWNYRYLLDESNNVSRNSSSTFTVDTPPVIEFVDQGIIALQAVIILKSASAWESTWDIASWRDDEIAYSNIQGARSRDTSLAQDQALLEEALKRRLHPGRINSMPGFHEPKNLQENR